MTFVVVTNAHGEIRSLVAERVSLAASSRYPATMPGEDTLPRFKRVMTEDDLIEHLLSQGHGRQAIARAASKLILEPKP